MRANPQRGHAGDVRVADHHLHQVRFSQFQVTDDLHFHLAQQPFRVLHTGRRGGRTCALGAHEALGHVQLPGVQFGHGPDITEGIDPDTHGQVGLATVRGEVKLADQRQRVFIDKDGHALDIAVGGLWHLGVDGDRHDGGIFGGIGSLELEQVLGGTLNNLPVLEVLRAEVLFPGLIREFLPVVGRGDTGVDSQKYE